MAKQRKEELPEGVVRVKESGKLFARITYYDENNKRKQKWRQAENVTEAKRLRRQLLNELEDHGARTVDAARMTFEHLAKHFEKNYLIEAEYRDGRKVRGRRSVETPRLQLETLRDFFKSRSLRSIKYADLVRLRAERLQKPTRCDIARYKQELLNDVPNAECYSTRSIASVNRELALLRKMFNVALQAGWIIKNPFHMGEAMDIIGDFIKEKCVLGKQHQILSSTLYSIFTGWNQQPQHMQGLVLVTVFETLQ